MFLRDKMKLIIKNKWKTLLETKVDASIAIKNLRIKKFFLFVLEKNN